MSRRHGEPKRDDEKERCRLAKTAAAQLPVWDWWLWAEMMATEPGGGDRRAWLRRMVAFRPWREHPDGRRDRWSVADEASRLGVEVDHLVLLHAVRWWGGYAAWDPASRRHMMQPDAWPYRTDGRGDCSPRTRDEEILDAAGEVRVALGWLSDAISERESAQMSMVELPALLRTLAQYADSVAAAEEELQREILRIGEVADGVERRLG